MTRRALEEAVNRHAQAKKMRQHFGGKVESSSADSRGFNYLVSVFAFQIEEEAYAAEELRHLAHIEAMSEPGGVLAALLGVPGVDALVAVPLILAVDIQKARSISALWRYCGFSVENGRAQRWNEKRPTFNKDMQDLLYEMQPKLSGRYADLYNESIKDYSSRRAKDNTRWGGAKRVEITAKRIVIKAFLGHLWITWRTIEGLTITPPRGVEAPPDVFGWPDLSGRHRFEY